MRKRIKNIPAFKRMLRKAARKAHSFTVAASAHAALSAVLKGLYTFEHVSPGDRPGYGTEVRGTAYALDLGGRTALLVHYKLVDEWGSLDYNHSEEGVALYDPFLGELRVLAYWGQHAGKHSFKSKLTKEIVAPKGSLWALVVKATHDGPLGKDWELRVKYPGARSLRRPRQLRRGAA
ncbi:hypothetical protein Ocepr_2261 (plasmid) [Oceanithermus profundus DSM 14977]|uniref:DUF1579 domain-containing protein n=1 Tax=Oceanithermus profundus (strain DSM 14977 / NBRC 100410 / VKM B-2274 / 506) TaxID=670487 RepID=E4UAS4_OCEP5|nr:hypothetical protein [Oceanithermus profundus]ADR37709.1 hypothetical protein Ocepr_2261 [Oceanithermus profundus DSM 14977]